MAHGRRGDARGAGEPLRFVLASFLLVVSCGGAAASPSPSPSAPNPSFTPYVQPSPQPLQKEEIPLPVPIEETAAAASGHDLYVMGGFDAAGNSLASTYVFDGSAWQGGPRLPLPLDHPSAAMLGSSVYIAGGHSFGSDSARLFRLDTDHWTELAHMNYARGGHALIASAGKLYAIGGNTARGNVSQVEAYDPAANSWSVVGSLPQPRNHLMGFALRGSVCVAGGRSPTTSRVDCFNGAWSSMPGLPQGTSGGGAAAFATGSVVVGGGEDATEARIVNQLARWNGNAWSADSMLDPRHGFELAIYEGRAWACGGGSAPGLHPVATCTSIGDPAATTRGR